MKVVLVSKRTHLVRPTIDHAGHIVITELESIDHLLSVLVGSTPQYVMLDKELVAAGLLEMVSPRFPIVRFACFDFAGRHSLRLTRAVLSRWKQNVPIPDVPEQRQILFAPEYLQYFASKPLACCSAGSDRTLDEAADLRRLADLYNTTRLGRASFEARLSGLCKFEAYEHGEIASHLLHTSVQAAADAREQVGRYLAVMAHSVPNVEVSCIPYPHDPAPIYRYVHYTASLETRYAIASVAAFGCHPEIFNELIAMLDWHHAGEDPSAFTKTSLSMLGLVFTLRHAAGAHAMVMSWLLDGLLPDPFTHADRRYLRMFRDFWGFSSWLNDPALLQRFIDNVSTYRQQKPVLPPVIGFPQFVRETQNLRKGNTK